MNISALICLNFLCSSDISLLKSPEHCKNDFGNDFENDLKSFHCSDDINFQIIDRNNFDFFFLNHPYGDFDFKIT